jgi:hypothetical protein
VLPVRIELTTSLLPRESGCQWNQLHTQTKGSFPQFFHMDSIFRLHPWDYREQRLEVGASKCDCVVPVARGAGNGTPVFGLPRSLCVSRQANLRDERHRISSTTSVILITERTGKVGPECFHGAQRRSLRDPFRSHARAMARGDLSRAQSVAEREDRYRTA